MPIRTIIALVLSPYYGMIILPSAVSVLFVAVAVTTVLGGVPLGSPVLLGMFLLLFNSAIFSQNARSAASITGLQSLAQQPKFTISLMRSLSGTFLVAAFIGIAAAGLYFAYEDSETVRTAAWLDPGKVGPALEAAAQAPATTVRTASLAGMNSESAFFMVLGASMVLITMLAMLIVPRATGLEDDFRRAYGRGLVLVRFLLALPFCGLMTLIIVNIILSAVEAFVSLFVSEFMATVLMLYLIEIFVFTAMIFTFETYALAIGRDLGAADKRREREIEREDTSEIRALRETWSRRA